MIKTYIKIAWRNMLKNKSATIINVAGLSLGMAATILLLLWVKNELNFDNYHPRAENIYYVEMGEAAGGQKFGGTPVVFAAALKKEIPGIEESTHFIPGNGFSSPVLSINDKYFREKSMVYVASNWFSFFHYDFVGGSIADFNQDPNSIILTASMAKKYFGTQDALGGIIRIDSADYRVRAVVKDNPSNSSFQFNIFLPEAMYLKKNAETAISWRMFSAETFMRTKANAGIAGVQKGISNIIVREVSTDTDNAGRKHALAAFITPLPAMHFSGGPFAARGDKKVVAIFAVLGFLLLIIASINYVNLSTARASQRSKEVSMKKIMGARTSALMGQFMTESLLTTVIALFLTLLITQLSLPWFSSLTEKKFSLSLMSISLWQVLAGTLLLTVLLTGIYPALLLSSFKPMNVLRGKNVLKIKDSSLRKILVTTQFTIAIALSVCTIVILRQLYFIQNSNEGYNRSQVFSFPVPNSFMTSGYMMSKNDLIQTLKTELKKETAIAHTTVSNEAIQNITMSMGGVIDWQGKQAGVDPNVTLLSVDADFTQMFNLQLQEGRWYDANNTADRHNYILTETTVAVLGLKKPYLGQFFAVMNDTGRIIGIVKDFHFRDYHNKISAAVLVASQAMKGNFFVQAAPSKMNQALAKTEAVFKKFYPQTPFEYKFMDAEFEKMYRADRKAATLISLFAGIAIFICSLGLLGLVAFVAERRTKEIGIRKVLGASVANITSLLSADFIRLVVLAILIASPLAWWAASEWLQTFAYRINISWWMFAVAGMAAVFIAVITVSIQAIKAATANPVKALRSE